MYCNATGAGCRTTSTAAYCMDTADGIPGGIFYYYCVNGVQRYCMQGYPCPFSSPNFVENNKTCSRTTAWPSMPLMATIANAECNTYLNNYINFFCSPQEQIYFSRGGGSVYCSPDPCVSFPNMCGQNKTCVSNTTRDDRLGLYSCLCSPGYSNISNSCIPQCNPNCQHGKCDAPNSCVCDSGWEGSDCNTAKCENRCIKGNCSLPDKCDCSPGWNGTACDNPICVNECFHGNCTEPNYCTCDYGWNGTTCENPICDYCSPGTYCIGAYTCSTAPVIYSVSPASTRGDNITITGINFGSESSVAIVKVNKTIDCFVLFLNNSQIICSIIGGEGANLTIFVSISSLNTSADLFTYYGCVEECLNGGICVSYKCNCTNHFIGPSCETQITCEINNGNCDNRVLCFYKNNSTEVSCGECPLGTVGNGYNCTTLCGDSICNATIGETCVSCPKDCNQTYCEKCGDGLCDITESCSTCSADCSCGITQCREGCTDHGVCDNGNCLCASGWSGPSCSSQLEFVKLETNNIKPKAMIIQSNSVQFLVGIKQINEITGNNGNSEIARAINVSDLSFFRLDNSSGSNSIKTYTSTLPFGAILTVIIYQFGETTTIEYANTTKTFSPNNIKVVINIQKWPFYNLNNKIQIIFDDNNNNNNNNNNNDNSCIQQQSDAAGNLRWVLLIIDNVSFYAQFEDKAIVDGRIRRVNFTRNFDSTVSATLPFFWFYADMDPNYSVLLGGEYKTETDECNPTSEEKRIKKETKFNTTIIVIIVPVVVSFIIAGAVVFVFRHKIQMYWKVQSTKSKIPSNVKMENRT